MCAGSKQETAVTMVGGIRSVMNTKIGPTTRRDDVASHAAKTETGRALITLAPVVPTSSTPDHRPQAGFLAHLIATAHQLPQTRERRRSEPEQAIALYVAAGANPEPAAGRKLRRAM